MVCVLFQRDPTGNGDTTRRCADSQQQRGIHRSTTSSSIDVSPRPYSLANALEMRFSLSQSLEKLLSVIILSPEKLSLKIR